MDVHDIPLTFQWVTPMLIGLIAFLVAIIGWIIKGYLASIDARFERINVKMSSYMERAERLIEKQNEQYQQVDRRLIILENHSYYK
jgi:hypothetical protein